MELSRGGPDPLAPPPWTRACIYLFNCIWRKLWRKQWRQTWLSVIFWVSVIKVAQREESHPRERPILRQIGPGPIFPSFSWAWFSDVVGRNFLGSAELLSPGTESVWSPPGTPVSSTRKLISSSSFHRLDMTLAVAEALNPNKPNQTSHERRAIYRPILYIPISGVYK